MSVNNMEYHNILIIKMSSLGDVLHTLPFVAVLRERFPGARLTWLVHPQYGALGEMVLFPGNAFPVAQQTL